VSQQLIPVATETSLVKIEGFVGLPQNARRRNALQYFFVNGRNMRHPYFHRAVMQCYENLISSDSHPTYFLDFKVDPSTIDVNIHPTKNEIKFENEQAIWQILTAAVKESLGRFNAVPSIDFDANDSLEIPIFAPDPNADPSLAIDTSYNPFNQPYTSEMGGTSGSTPSSWQRESRANTGDWQQLYKDFERRRNTDVDQASAMPFETHGSALNSSTATVIQGLESAESSANTVKVIQLQGRYIVTPSHAGLMIIDQHRAHERVLYERFLGMIETGSLSSQRLIFPESLEVTAAQGVMLESIQRQLADMGWDISCIGPNSWAINGQPAVLSNQNAVETLMQILDDFMSTGQPVADDMLSRMARSLARAAAIKAGQPLSPEEMDRLMSDLFKLSSPGYTVDGRAVINVISTDDISKMF
jgi:DNA mismatch repair protein MutL